MKYSGRPAGYSYLMTRLLLGRSSSVLYGVAASSMAIAPLQASLDPVSV